MHKKSEPIKCKDDIKKIKQYFISSGTSYGRLLEWDKQLLYFVLGINTCYKTEELLNLKWSDIFNYDTMSVKDYIEYTGYKFYLNNNCKNAIFDFIEKYNKFNVDTYVFASRSKVYEPITNEGINRVYRKMQKELGLPFNFSTMSLRKTFAYWQIYYCQRDYIKMSKLRELLHTTTMSNDINIFSGFDFENDMIYTNEINL